MLISHLTSNNVWKLFVQFILTELLKRLNLEEMELRFEEEVSSINPNSPYYTYIYVIPPFSFYFLFSYSIPFYFQITYDCLLIIFLLKELLAVREQLEKRLQNEKSEIQRLEVWFNIQFLISTLLIMQQHTISLKF